MLEADRARRTMTAGAVGGRKGGTASANKRLRKALKDSPRVKVVASAPANAKERRGAARHQPAPLLLDAKALDVLTTQVVMGVLGSLTLTNKQRSLCTVAAAAAATAVGHAIGQLARKVAGRAQSDPKTEKTVLKGAERIASDNDTGPAAKRAKTRSASTSSGHTTQHTCTATQCLSGAAAPKKRKRPAAAASAAAVETALHAAASDAPPPPDAAALGGSQRGALLVVQPTAAYAARSDYSFEDVVALARKLDAGELQPARNADLRDKCEANKIGLIAPPSHTSAASHGRTQQMDLPASMGGTIAAVKACWRRLMRKQHRAAMLRDDRKGVVSVAEIAAMLEQALESTWQPEKAVAMNEEVGYYIDATTGRLAWDLTRRLTLADALQAEDARAGASRFHRREAAIEAQAAQSAALGVARSQMEAAGVAIAGARTAAVAPPTVPVPRSKAALNSIGCYISGPDHGRELAATTQKQQQQAADKEARADAVWTVERRKQVAATEAKLEELGGSVERLAGSYGGVGHLRVLIWSRTGHGPKAKNNTAPDCLLTAEATAACLASAVTKCPPEIDEAPVLSGEGSGGEGSGGEGSGAAEEADGPSTADEEEMAEGEAEEGEEMDEGA